MPNFYRQHSKLISVLLVAVFVVVGIKTASRAVLAMGIPMDPRFDHTEEITVLQESIANGNFWKPVWLDNALASMWTNSSEGQSDIESLRANYERYALSLENRLQNTSDEAESQRIEAELARVNAVLSDPNKLTEDYNSSIKDAQSDIRESTGNPADKVVGTMERLIGMMIAWSLYGIAAALGWIMMLLAKVMLAIGVFNNFLGQPIVQVGWTIIRDICNNFFIILMMIMAISVTIRPKKYSWQSMLPQILIGAVLINFSLTITGIAIDVSQVLMLTFASPLATTQGYNIIISAFNLPSAFAMSDVLKGFTDDKGQLTGQAQVSVYDLIAALIFAIIATIVAIVVIICITAILIYRIIILMFLTVLSPLYFFAKASENIPGIKKIASEWESNLINALIIGPAMMFFLYLSFMAMAAINHQGGQVLVDSAVNDRVTATANLNSSGGQTSALTGADSLTKTDTSSKSPAITAEQQSANSYIALSKMASVEGVLNFMIVVGLLFMSLIAGKKVGGLGSDIAGQGANWLKGSAKKYSGFNLAKKGGAQLAKAPGAAVSMVGAKVGTGALGLASATTRGLGTVLKSEGLQKLGDVGSQWRSDVLGGRRKARIDKLNKIAASMGLKSEDVKTKWGEFTDTDLAKRAKKAALVVGATGTALTAGVLTGGLGLLPAGVAAAAGAYLGGGGRLAEIRFGKWGMARAKDREDKQKKIDALREETGQLVKDSEEVRDKDNKDDANAYFTNPTHRAAKNSAESAQARMSKIENAKLTDRNSSTGTGLDPEIIAALTADGWTTGTEITDAMLQKAINDVKAGTAGTAGFWTGQEANVSAFAPHQAVIDHAKDVREIEHKKRVEGALDAKVTSATPGSEKKMLEVERKRFETEYDANTTLKLDTSRLQADLKAKIAVIDGTGLTEFEKIAERKKAKNNNIEELARANKSYTDTITPVQHQAPKPRALDTVLGDFKPYAHENWVSQGVAKDAAKMMKTVKDLISAMEGAGGELLDGYDHASKGSFYSNSGQTETQFKSIKAMMDSTKTMQNLISALSSMDKDVYGSQAQLVKELKQGIAAYQKAGGDTSKLTAIINLLNDKKGYSKEGAGGKVIDDKSVNEYQNEVKPKK